MTFVDSRDLIYLSKFNRFDARWGSSALLALAKLSRCQKVSRSQKQHAKLFLEELRDLIKDYPPYPSARIRVLRNKYPTAQWGFVTLDSTTAPPHHRMAFKYAVYARYLETPIAKKLLGIAPTGKV